MLLEFDKRGGKLSPEFAIYLLELLATKDVALSRAKAKIKQFREELTKKSKEKAVSDAKLARQEQDLVDTRQENQVLKASMYKLSIDAGNKLAFKVLLTFLDIVSGSSDKLVNKFENKPVDFRNHIQAIEKYRKENFPNMSKYLFQKSEEARKRYLDYPYLLGVLYNKRYEYHISPSEVIGLCNLFEEHTVGRNFAGHNFIPDVDAIMEILRSLLSAPASFRDWFDVRFVRDLQLKFQEEADLKREKGINLPRANPADDERFQVMLEETRASVMPAIQSYEQYERRTSYSRAGTKRDDKEEIQSPATRPTELHRLLDGPLQSPRPNLQDGGGRNCQTPQICDGGRSIGGERQYTPQSAGGQAAITKRHEVVVEEAAKAGSEKIRHKVLVGKATTTKRHEVGSAAISVSHKVLMDDGSGQRES